jgi:hypothetical protein
VEQHTVPLRQQHCWIILRASWSMMRSASFRVTGRGGQHSVLSQQSVLRSRILQQSDSPPRSGGIYSNSISSSNLPVGDLVFISREQHPVSHLFSSDFIVSTTFSPSINSRKTNGWVQTLHFLIPECLCKSLRFHGKDVMFCERRPEDGSGDIPLNRVCTRLIIERIIEFLFRSPLKAISLDPSVRISWEISGSGNPGARIMGEHVKMCMEVTSRHFDRGGWLDMDGGIRCTCAE